jgi:hypothetical protein
VEADAIGDAILASLNDATMRFVFPSEVAARDRLERSLERSGRRALPLERFISWDAFKALAFPGPPAGRPASSALRSVFARSLMEENADRPFLSALVPPAKASASPRFARLVAKALPALRGLDGLPASSPLLRDWQAIRARYAAFLSERGLYEPGWNERTARALEGAYTLFYPDLTTDWADYEQAVRALPNAALMLADGLSDGPLPAAAFATIVDEVRAVLLALQKAIAEGCDPSRILISVAAPESVLPVLEREAAVAGVALDLREARPLSESSGGRLLADLLRLAQSQRSFSAMRSLLLDRSRPWKAGLNTRALIDLGIRKHILAALPGVDIWEASMGPKDDEERRLYRGLRGAAERIADAAGFGQLRSAFDAFRRAFLDETGWTPAQNDELARCVRELETLEEASKAAGIGRIDGAAGAFLEELEELRYLPVSDAGGIPVYRFPVAAGCLPTLHFALNLSEGAAKAASRPLAFLRDDERESLGAHDRDLSPGLIALLARSGERVFLSYSEDGPDGIRAAHQAIEPLAPQSVGLADDRDLWPPNADGLSPARTVASGPPSAVQAEVFPIQSASARAALATALPPKASARAGSSQAASRSYSEGRPERASLLGPGIRERVAAAQSTDGMLNISDTLIEELEACAFKRLFNRYLKVRPVDTGLSFVDALMTGSIYHDALEALFRPLAEAGRTIVAGGSPSSDSESDAAAEGETLRPDKADAASALDRAILEQERAHGPFAGMLLRTSRPAFLRDLERALDALLPKLDGLLPVMVEKPNLSAALPLSEGDARLIGRMDLVCAPPTGASSTGAGARPLSQDEVAPKGAVIIDFKKRSLPKPKDLAPDEEGRLGRYQMPAYAYLLKAAGYEPQAAYYLSIEGPSGGKRIVCAFGPDAKAAVPLEGIPALLAALERAAARAAGRLRRGEVYLPHEDDQDQICADCDYRPLCRVHYTVH